MVPTLTSHRISGKLFFLSLRVPMYKMEIIAAEPYEAGLNFTELAQ